jgi:hypothetical protein
VKELTSGFFAFNLSSQKLVSKLLPQRRIIVLETMSGRTVAISAEEILNTRVGEAPSHDEALQSLSRAPAEMMLASRPRTYDR